MGNADRHLSRKECTGIRLQALGVPPQEIRQVLLPVQGRFPTTEAEFQTMCSTLRKWYHQRKNAPQHLYFAHAQQSNDRSNVLFTEPEGMIYMVSQPEYDPWSAADPWGGGTNSLRESPLITQAPPQQQTAYCHS